MRMMLLDLPEDVLCRVIGHLNGEERMTLSRVNVWFRNYLRSVTSDVLGDAHVTAPCGNWLKFVRSREVLSITTWEVTDVNYLWAMDRALGVRSRLWEELKSIGLPRKLILDAMQKPVTKEIWPVIRNLPPKEEGRHRKDNLTHVELHGRFSDWTCVFLDEVLKTDTICDVFLGCESLPTRFLRRFLQESTLSIRALAVPPFNVSDVTTLDHFFHLCRRSSSTLQAVQISWDTPNLRLSQFLDDFFEQIYDGKHHILVYNTTTHPNCYRLYLAPNLTPLLPSTWI